MEAYGLTKHTKKQINSTHTCYKGQTPPRTLIFSPQSKLNKVCRLVRQDTPRCVTGSEDIALKISTLTVSLTFRTAIQTLPQNTRARTDTQTRPCLVAKG